MTAIVRTFSAWRCCLSLDDAHRWPPTRRSSCSTRPARCGAQIDGKPKLEIARETLRTVLQTMPADLELGFMAYGHREKGDCEDIELVVPPAAGTAGAITGGRRQAEIPRQDAAVGRREAGRRSAEIHRGQGDGDPHHRWARNLQRRPLRGRQGAGAGRRRLHRPCRRLRPDGGGGQAGRLPRREHRRQIYPGRRRGRAEGRAGRRPSSSRRPRRRRPRPGAGAGDSRSSTSCRRCCWPKAAIRSPTAMPGRSTRPRPTAAAATTSPPNTTTYKGHLEPGDYVVVAELGEARTEQLVKVEAGRSTSRSSCSNAGTLLVHPRAERRRRDRRRRGRHRRISRRRPPRATATPGSVLPAGEQKVTVKIGNGRRPRRSSSPPARRSRRTSSSASAIVVANAFYATGGDKVEAAGWPSSIVKAKKKIDGTREDMGYDLRAGQQVRPADRRLCR